MERNRRETHVILRRLRSWWIHTKREFENTTPFGQAIYCQFTWRYGDREHGTLTQLNIWDYEISSDNVVAMSAGGFNVHGSVLSWSSFAKYIPDASMQLNTDIYLPGKLTLAFFGFFTTAKQNTDYLLNFLHAI